MKDGPKLRGVPSQSTLDRVHLQEIRHILEQDEWVDYSNGFPWVINESAPLAKPIRYVQGRLQRFARCP